MLSRPLKLAAFGLLSLSAVTLAACSMGGPASPAGLHPGLSAPMDQPGARLDSVQAVGLINAYRATNGVAPLQVDDGLNGTAQALANQYAQTGTAPSKPQALNQMKLSAGYQTFAETFSGWRNNPADAAGLLAQAGKAGIAVASNPSSAYGVYWVLVIGN
ncbi:CAP domain-containing protein [Devosia sp. PTR5]|uniref:CAP domain-containing protein n=1 Tax=Devosia oryzisoli TaxID=2774138 RepID=A0A927IRK3_9HYPH|nr:CAP domain-containing protein [Devosia oryzisoli]MBD8064504.1 CAP domain-containing protein [Devosia oryzisoli]